MKAIVVHSANDSSVAMAEYLAGSTEAFVVMMNAEAAKLGMKDTHYYSVHGLPPAPGQQADVASAYDQALLARALVKHPQVLQWSGITTAPFRAGTFELRNTNHLVFNYNGCDGLKTGFYNKAGFNVVATAHRGGLRLIAVVLGSPRKGENFRSAGEMLSEGFAQYEMKAIAKKGSASNVSVAVTDGSAPKIVPVWGDDAAIFMKRGDEKTSYKVNYSIPAMIAAPVRAGQKIGSAEVIVDGQSTATVALLAPSDVAAKKATLVDRVLSKF
jgi:D-alanyl-D-alanine carboxypeptidase (penicillin-binding protein 5/6)